MTHDYYSSKKEEFDKDTDELLNKICNSFHDELKVIADKYGSVVVCLKMFDFEEIKNSDKDYGTTE